MNKRTILSINTSKTDIIQIFLDIDGNRTLKLKKTQNIGTSQITLPLIERTVIASRISIDNVSDIYVHIGPGSFTGLRVGASVANALGYLLDIPVNGGTTSVVPDYQDVTGVLGNK